MTRSAFVAALLATTSFSFTAARAAEPPPRPMFAVVPHLTPNVKLPNAAALPPTWKFSFAYQGTTYTDAFIGGDPSTATSVTVPIVLIPLTMVYGSTTEAASTIIKKIEKSPIFSPMDFNFGGTDIGVTQYEDAFAKVNVWNIGGSASGYHVLLGKPKVEKTQTLTIPANDGSVGTEFGATVILAGFSWFQGQINKLLTTVSIPEDSLPIFVTTETYLTSGGCCIGGYHSVGGLSRQPYAMFTYIQESGAFSQDVSALSHELGEWIDDPNTNNNSPCGILEVGDPLENDSNFGTYPYKLHGFTYHLQDLALLPYFGVPKGTTLNQLFTLQGTKLTVCQNGS